ncbi:MAG: M42 family metallopeptidase [Bacillota bacterium]
MDDVAERLSDREFLAQMCEASGLSGSEDRLANVIARQFSPLVDEVRKDALGNLIMLKRGSAEDGPSLMLAAHMDEIGLMVTAVEEGGFLRFTKVGGIDPRNLPAKEVLILAADEPVPGIIGVKPPHLTSPEEREKAIKLEDMYIDVGLEEEGARARIRVGDAAVFRRTTYRLTGDRMAGKAMDDRSGVAALYEAAVKMQSLRSQVDVYFVATVQEEVGLRGAVTSTYDIMPDVAIAVDVGYARSPGTPEHVTAEMGEGPAISQGANIHPHLFERLTEVAREERIPHQREILPGASGTDAWSMQVTRSGVPTALVSIPLRYMHSTVEMLSWSDVRNAGALLAYFAAGMDRRFVEGFYYDAQ